MRGPSMKSAPFESTLMRDTAKASAAERSTPRDTPMRGKAIRSARITGAAMGARP